jgi:hypothetical protein
MSIYKHISYISMVDYILDVYIYMYIYIIIYALG